MRFPWVAKTGGFQPYKAPWISLNFISSTYHSYQAGSSNLPSFTSSKSYQTAITHLYWINLIYFHRAEIRTKIERSSSMKWFCIMVDSFSQRAKWTSLSLKTTFTQLVILFNLQPNIFISLKKHSRKGSVEDIYFPGRLNEQRALITPGNNIFDWSLFSIFLTSSEKFIHIKRPGLWSCVETGPFPVKWRSFKTRFF